MLNNLHRNKKLQKEINDICVQESYIRNQTEDLVEDIQNKERLVQLLDFMDAVV